MHKKRKNYTSPEKVSILKEHLIEKVPVSDLCDKYDLPPTVFYRWQKEFFEKSVGAFDNLRPFVVGRKGWLFSGHPNGAKASATLYSLVETAKACGLEPYHYLRHLFENLPFAQAQEDHLALLPQRLTPELLNRALS